MFSNIWKFHLTVLTVLNYLEHEVLGRSFCPKVYPLETLCMVSRFGLENFHLILWNKVLGKVPLLMRRGRAVPNQSCSKCPEKHFGFGMFKPDKIVFLLNHIHTNTHYRFALLSAVVQLHCKILCMVKSNWWYKCVLILWFTINFSRVLILDDSYNC